MNLGNAIFGLIAASVLWLFVVYLVIWIFVWPPTRDIAKSLAALCIGLGATIGMKMVITRACRKRQYRAFFRIQPRAARVSSLALECWFIGLGGGVL
jgi:hypothetical protein